MAELGGVSLDSEVDQDCPLVVSTSNSDLIVSLDETQPSASEADAELQKVVVPDNCVVILNGQKCHLKVNPENGVLVAYPIGEETHDKQEQPETVSQISNSSEQQTSSSDVNTLAAAEISETNHVPSVERQLSLEESDAPVTHTIISTKILKQPPTATSIISPKPAQLEETHVVISTPSAQSFLPSNTTNRVHIENPVEQAGMGEPILGLKISQSDLEKLRCPSCDFQAYYTLQLDEHMKGEHGSLIHNCRCCSYFGLSEEMLLDHYHNVHPKNICKECNLVSEHAYIINRHKSRHGKGCICDKCGKTYKDKYILQMHIKMVHTAADVLFECHLCNKSFNRKAHLNRHIRTHSSEKPFKCPHCDYRGGERSDITKHLVIHKPPQFSCEFCGKTFRHSKNRDLHVKRHAGQRDYKCGVCEFYGYTFTDIRKHIERRHSDIKSFICEKCGSTFKSELSFTEHQLTWHQSEPSAVSATTTSGELDSMISSEAEGQSQIVDDKLNEHLYASTTDSSELQIIPTSDIEIATLGSDVIE